MSKFLGYFFYLLVPLLSIPDDGYSEKTSCIPNLISTFLFNHIFFKSKLTPNWTIWKYQLKLPIHFMRIKSQENHLSWPHYLIHIYHTYTLHLTLHYSDVVVIVTEKIRRWRRSRTQTTYIFLPPSNSNKMPGLLLVSVGDITSSLYIPASSLSTLWITNCGLFTSQELPENLKQLILRVVLQLSCVFCQLTCNDPVKFDIIFAFILIVPP